MDLQPIVIVLAFAVLAFLVYKFWKPYVAPPKREVPKDEAKLYFFYTDWCGFSKKAMPEWEKIEAGPKTFGNTTVTFTKVNCDEDKSTANLYEVEAYPTVKLETSSGLYNYSGPMTHKKIQHFLHSSLGKESGGL